MTVRQATVVEALRVLAAAARFYRDGHWNDDYPGGIDCGWDRHGYPCLDTGGEAARALRDRRVRRVLDELGIER